MAIYNFGSINIDHVYLVPHFVSPGETLSSTDYHSVLGGKGANQSIACALAGADVKHIGCVHENDTSFVHSIRSAGVDCQYIVEQTATATGHAMIQVTESGENAIVLCAGANHAIDISHINSVLDKTEPNDWVLLQNETNAIEIIIEAAAEKGLKIAFNPAPMTPSVAQLPLEKVELLIVNEVEAMQLSNTTNVDDANKALQASYPNTKILMTLGKDGVKYLHGSQHISMPSFSVDAIDTTAAGDTFTGYFLAHYIEKVSPEQALQRACAAAAIAVTRSGAAPSIPFEHEVDEFLANAK